MPKFARKGNQHRQPPNASFAKKRKQDAFEQERFKQQRIDYAIDAGLPVETETQLAERQQHRAEKNMRRHSIALLKRAKRNQDVIFTNKLISDFGTSKQLGFALQAYTDLRENKLQPTVYTFTNLINACVRCGEVLKAREFLTEMEKTGVEPNEVTYTALIKGLCQDQQIDEACALLETMKEKNIVPNLRTFNTLLRGCLRSGYTSTAEKLLQVLLVS